MAQVSPGSISFAYTGSAVPGQSGFTRLLREQGLAVGPFRVHPFLGVGELYTDNVFRSNTARESDFIHAIAPGIQVQLPFASYHTLAIDYRALKTFHQRFRTNDVLRQGLTGQMNFNFPGGLLLRFQGGYTKGFDLRGSAVDVQALEPTRWTTRSFTGEGETRGNFLRMRFRVGVVDWNFENNDQGPRRNRLDSRGDLTLFAAVGAKTSVLLNFGVSRPIYDQNTQLDHLSFRVSSGLRWRATGKINGEVQVGYEFLNFDNAPIILPAGSLLSSGGSSRQNLRVTGSLTWNATSRSSLTFRPFRVIRQSGVLGTSTFTQTGVRLNGRHAIGVRTSLNAGFTYTNDEFEVDNATQASANRTDDRVRGSFGVRYQAVRWLGINAQYEYSQRSSSIDNFEFYANTLMVSIQGVF